MGRRRELELERAKETEGCEESGHLSHKRNFARIRKQVYKLMKVKRLKMASRFIVQNSWNTQDKQKTNNKN